MFSFFKLFKKEPVQVGDKAPDFELSSYQNQKIRLSSFQGKKWVVLYFYPKDNTYGCIAESCSFRDRYKDFLNAGAEVIGISSDSDDSHRKFSSKYRLPFHLLSDPKNKVRDLYGVPPFLGVLPGRTTYLINKDGEVKNIFSSNFQIESHVKKTLEFLQSKSESLKP